MDGYGRRNDINAFKKVTTINVNWLSRVEQESMLSNYKIAMVIVSTQRSPAISAHSSGSDVITWRAF
jgi:hypothetical protein